MWKNRVILLRHPNVYEDTKRRLKFDPEASSVDTEFKSWDFIYDSKYSITPLQDLIAQITSQQSTRRLLLENLNSSGSLLGLRESLEETRELYMPRM